MGVCNLVSSPAERSDWSIGLFSISLRTVLEQAPEVPPHDVYPQDRLSRSESGGSASTVYQGETHLASTPPLVAGGGGRYSRLDHQPFVGQVPSLRLSRASDDGGIGSTGSSLIRRDSKRLGGSSGSLLRRTSSEADLDLGDALMAELRRSHDESRRSHFSSEDALEMPLPTLGGTRRSSLTATEEEPPVWTAPLDRRPPALPPRDSAPPVWTAPLDRKPPALPPRDSARTSQLSWQTASPRVVPHSPSPPQHDVIIAPALPSATTPRLSKGSASNRSTYFDARTSSIRTGQGFQDQESAYTAAAVAGTQSFARPITYERHGQVESTGVSSSTTFRTPFATPSITPSVLSRAPTVAENMLYQEKAPSMDLGRVWDDDGMSQISEPISSWSLLRELEEQSSVAATEWATAQELPLNDKPPSLVRRPVMRKAATHASERSESSRPAPQPVASKTSRKPMARSSQYSMSSQALDPFITAPTSIASRSVSRYMTASEGRTPPRSQASVSKPVPVVSRPLSTSAASIPSRSTANTTARIKVPSLSPVELTTQASTSGQSTTQASSSGQSTTQASSSGQSSSSVTVMSVSNGRTGQLALRDVIVSAGTWAGRHITETNVYLLACRTCYTIRRHPVCAMPDTSAPSWTGYRVPSAALRLRWQVAGRHRFLKRTPLWKTAHSCRVAAMVVSLRLPPRHQPPILIQNRRPTHRTVRTLLDRLRLLISMTSRA